MIEPIQNVIAFLRRWSDANRKVGYDELSKTVNEPYGRIGDVRESMKETDLPVEFVWDMTELEDCFDFEETVEVQIIIDYRLVCVSNF